MKVAFRLRQSRSDLRRPLGKPGMAGRRVHPRAWRPACSLTLIGNSAPAPPGSYVRSVTRCARKRMSARPSRIPYSTISRNNAYA